jgi:hypothetical protein
MASWLSGQDAADIPEASRLRQSGLHSGKSETIVPGRNNARKLRSWTMATAYQAAAAGTASVVRTF